MTLLKRLLTAAALFLPLLVIVYFGICMVGGGIAGARVSMDNPRGEDLTPRSEEAGRAFVQNNITTIAVASFGTASILSLAIPFSGLLPWCRKPRQVPPPLPPQFTQ